MWARFYADGAPAAMRVMLHVVKAESNTLASLL